jgi:hypothetical protein
MQYKVYIKLPPDPSSLQLDGTFVKDTAIDALVVAVVLVVAIHSISASITLSHTSIIPP